MLAEQILLDHDIYVGMKFRAKFERSRDLFDQVVQALIKGPATGNCEQHGIDRQGCGLVITIARHLAA